MAGEPEQERCLRYAGVPVRFPYEPYRAQNALMHGVVTAANKGGHALLESPTGTGKSLALLCSALGWQEDMAEKIKERRQQVSARKMAELHVEAPPAAAVRTPTKAEAIADGGDGAATTGATEKRIERSDGATSAGATEKKSDQRNAENVPSPKTPRRRRTKRRARKRKTEKVEEEGSGSDADFQTPMEFRDTSWQKHTKLKRPRESIFGNAHLVARFESWERDAPLDSSGDDDTEEDDDLSDDEERGGIPRKLPRIFYAARTHNQVSQVVDELRKTSYRPSITILASRREYCIRPEVQRLKNRNEVCKGLLKARQCALFHKVQDVVHSSELEGAIWDIEELNNVAKRVQGCPYYASAEMYKSAEIIFCPYNYIVDKTVRESSGINIKNDIILFDEAHNIENHARECASFSMDVANLRRVVDDLNEMVDEGKLGPSGSDMALAASDIIDSFASFLRLTDAVVAGRLEQRDNMEFALFEGDDLAALFDEHFIDTENGDQVCERSIEKCRNAISLIRENHDEDEQKTQDGTPGPSNNAAAGFGYATDNGGLSTTELRQRKRRQRARSLLQSGQDGEDEFANKPSVSRCLFVAHKLTTTMEYYFAHRSDYCLVIQRHTRDLRMHNTLNLWCLNSAVSFKPLCVSARTIVVTSGTLSPLRSFAGELGTRFQVSKSLPHVIDVRNQLHVGVVARGPDDTLFDATFSSSNTFKFQDALGNALTEYCGIVPSGVLVFLPSYRMLDSLRTRWQFSGCLDRLGAVKGGVFFEPRGRGEEFDKMMADYSVAASAPNGAVLFGVCRGKLAEGIDFRDENARAVMIVGIPFPHNGDIQVSRKKAWNNRVRNEGNAVALLPGSDWYEIQGFRALNQALGRTIRHRHDYGSILLLDHRYRNPDVLNQLPDWTQKAVTRGRGSHDEATRRLRNFFHNVHDRIGGMVS